MYKSIKNILAILLFLAVLPVFANDLVAIPKLQRINDLTASLTQDQIQKLNHKLVDLEQKKGSQIAILIVPSVLPEDIDQYAVRAFAQYKLGRKGIDDGVLLVIAKQDHKLRIEVGYGLEGAIPDVTAKRIIRDYITPNFKQDDFYQGINEAVDALTARIKGESLPAPSKKDDQSNLWPMMAILILFCFLSYCRRYSGYSGGGGYPGGGSGGGSSGGGFGGGGGSSGGGGASGGW